MIWGFVIAIISGALMSVQGVFNTGLTKQSSLWVASSWVQCSALIVCLLAWVFKDRSSFLVLKEVHPFYFLTGGILGALITLTVIMSVSNLGPAKSALLIVIAQMTMSYVIEVFGLFGSEKTPIHWMKVLGLLVAAAGFVLFNLKQG